MANPATSAPEENIITLYDDMTKYDLQKVVAHELAHFLYFSMPDTVKESYHKTAEWKKNKQNIFSTPREVFTASDGISSPEEDFANNVESYLFDKKNLQRNSAIYNWMEKFTGEQK